MRFEGASRFDFAFFSRSRTFENFFSFSPQRAIAEKKNKG
jgi:hypothetical protein